MAGWGSEAGSEGAETSAVAGGGAELVVGAMASGAAGGTARPVSGSLAVAGDKVGERGATESIVIADERDSPRRENDGDVEVSVSEMRSDEVSSVESAGKGAGGAVDGTDASGGEEAVGGEVGSGCRNGGGLGRERRRTGPVGRSEGGCAEDVRISKAGGSACGRGGRSGRDSAAGGGGTGGGAGSARSSVGSTTRSNAEQVPSGMGGALGCGVGLGSAGGLADFAASRR